MTRANGKRLAAGDWVEVRPASEILASLDARGTLRGLVFMPEMLGYCGQRFQVSRRAEQVCIDGAPVPAGESRVRGFPGDDVVLLDGLRCSGVSHGGCQRGCTLFWKETWLRSVSEAGDHPDPSPPAEMISMDLPPAQKADGTFYCQSSELPRMTHHIPLFGRLRNLGRNVLRGNYGAVEMLRILAVWTYCRVRHRLIGEYSRGHCKKTPTEVLNLQAGEWVQVKPLAEIIATLDEKGKNRGLHFSSDMVPYCGKRLQVLHRADNLIAEGTGVMSHLRNTVILKDSVCDSAVFAFGGCPREHLLYWREIWLIRVEQSANRRVQSNQSDPSGSRSR